MGDSFTMTILAYGGVYMDLNYSLIGMRIRNKRLEQKLTQDKLSEMSGISPQHLSHIESGNTKLSLPCLVNLCNALSITADSILCDSVDNSTPYLLREVSSVFTDCSPDEIFLMLSQADSLKKSLRLKNIIINKE